MDDTWDSNVKVITPSTKVPACRSTVSLSLFRQPYGCDLPHNHRGMCVAVLQDHPRVEIRWYR